jgi:hypothetical protein
MNRCEISLVVARALRESPELVADLWLAEQGYPARSENAPEKWARDNYVRESRRGGSRGRQAVAFPSDEVGHEAEFEDTDPLSLLLRAEEEADLVECEVDPKLGTAERARVAHRTRRRVQQLDKRRREARESGQGCFFGFGWAEGA